MTHVPASSGDNIRPPSIQATCRLPKLDPWRSNQNRLPANGVYIPILHTTQRPCANPCTYDHRVGGSRLSRAERAVDNLLDVLHRRANERPTTGRKRLVQPEEVVGRVDADGREMQTGLEDRRRKRLRWGCCKLGNFESISRRSREPSTCTPHTPPSSLLFQKKLTSGITLRTDGPKSGSVYSSVWGIRMNRW